VEGGRHVRRGHHRLLDQRVAGPEMAKEMNAMKLAVPLLVARAYAPSQGLAAPILAPDLASFAVLAPRG
jgi:hypothetical protein